jgi:hypothetical protein
MNDASPILAQPPPHRTMSLTERIHILERLGHIDPTFSPEEILLSERIASAWWFWWAQQELPSRCREGTDEEIAFDMGIQRVNRLRRGRD